ncbi:ABC transporter ATP-binding protein [Salipaludibacillus sp. HK11]|uniref:ABC transporter ATP-binding protein n=1 Tax=Salipaludibacillus sp. HK11 TaxID=3394320 RepID=UPI0039FCA8C0
MVKASVELTNLSKSYDEETFAVKEANVSIEPGEFFVLVGPSGCGKSTMLRMIAGLEAITAGEIRMGGVFANDIPPSKRNISMVFQNYALYPHLTVEENILFGLKVRKVPKQEQKRRCLEATNMLGMTEYLKRKPRELSGGQRQRIALARAVVSQMPICLMDEPLSNLDAKLRGQMRTEIRELQQNLGITMIYVTHDQIEAMTMGDRIMVLKDGVIQQVGRPLDIYNQPANEFVASFIGAPPMNIATASEEDENLVIGNDLFVKIEPFSRKIVNGRRIHMGVRPEHLILEPEMVKMSPPFVTINVTINHVEVLGNETVIAFNVGEKVWKAKSAGQWQYKKGEKIAFHIDYNNIHLFDGETGEILDAKVGSHLTKRSSMATEVVSR